MKKIIIFIVLINLWRCKDSEVNCDKSVALFFNPVSLKDNTYHFTAFIGKRALVDTSLKSTQIDQSVLIKCFDADQTTSLTININSKKIVLNIDSILKLNGPTSVFTFYDNRIILDSLFESYTKRSIKTTGIIPVYNEFVDSLTAHSLTTSKFDSLMIYVNKDKCWCDRRNLNN